MNLSDKLRHQCFHRFFVLKWNVVVTLIACTYFNRDAILVESLDKVGTVTATTTSMNELMPLVKLAKARNEGRTTRLLLSQKVMMTAPRRRAPVPSLLHWCIFSVFYSKILFGCQQQKVPDAINLPSRSTQKLVRTCLVGCQQSTFWIFKLLLFISFFFWKIGVAIQGCQVSLSKAGEGSSHKFWRDQEQKREGRESRTKLEKATGPLYPFQFKSTRSAPKKPKQVGRENCCVAGTYISPTLIHMSTTLDMLQFLSYWSRYIHVFYH